MNNYCLLTVCVFYKPYYLPYFLCFLVVLFIYCMRMPVSRKTTKQMCEITLGSVCGDRTETMQENENILKSLVAVIHKNKNNVPALAKRLCSHGLEQQRFPNFVSPYISSAFRQMSTYLKTFFFAETLWSFVSQLY